MFTTGIGKKPSFDSAMSLFTKAQNELKAASEAVESRIVEVEKEWGECKTEQSNIARVQAFFNKLLTGEGE